jgi:tetratricopeptide (TPR) repeat protein/transcriptional regulator with XRE-family HTH domain
VAVRVRRRLPGLRVRPGAVREARHEAGLSLAGVARGDLSRTAIFLIETGKSNPTLPTLELISERTGKPVEFFLDDEPPPHVSGIDFVELEQLLAENQYQRVIDGCEELLAGRLSRADQARLRFLEGLAYIRQADAEHAAPFLKAAREYYEATSQKALAVEILGWETHIPYLLEDPEALSFAEAALARCRQLNPVPVETEARILTRIGGIHLFNQNWAEAVKVFEVAAAKLGPMRDLKRTAMIYGDLGWAYRELDQPELASRYAQKSIAIHEMLRDRYSASMAEDNLGLALLNMKRFDAAEEHLNRSLDLLNEMGRERGKGGVLLSKAELDLARGRVGEARAAAEEGLELATRLGERGTEASAHLWLGRIAAEQGDRKATDREFTTGLDQLGRLNLTERLVRAHAAYAEILEERGDVAGANQQLKKVLALQRPDLISAGIREERRQQLA